ncbi:hypothetical protein ACROYT_G025516 [Oculina patagonica]
MASIGQCSRSAFRRVNHSSFASNSSSSFSIRSILNLPEAEKSQQCTQALDDMLASSPVWLCPPLVPRVVLPMVNCYNGHPLCKGLINQQQFGCTPQQNVWSTLAEREIPFKVGVNRTSEPSWLQRVIQLSCSTQLFTQRSNRKRRDVMLCCVELGGTLGMSWMTGEEAEEVELGCALKADGYERRVQVLFGLVKI